MFTKEQIVALKTTINDYEWGFSNRTKRVLENIGIIGGISEVVQLTEYKLSMSKGCGRTTLREIVQRLSEKGLYLGMKSEDVVKALYADITAPSTEREVWIDENKYILPDIICPQTFSAVLDGGFGSDNCFTKCAWFRKKDGLAMCGERVIGKLIEKEETR